MRPGMLTPVSTLLCRVKRRLPVAVVDLYGTFDDSSAVSGVISLREHLADQPMALVLDVSHLSMSGRAAASALLHLADDAATWPGARLALCGAGPGIRALLEQTERGRTRPAEPRPATGVPGVEQRVPGDQRSPADPPAPAKTPSGSAPASTETPSAPEARAPGDALTVPPDGPGPGSRPATAVPGIGQRTPGVAGVDLYDRVEDAVRVALLAPVPRRHSVRLAPDRHAPEQARITVDRSCGEWGVPRLSQLAQVIVSELVTNAVVHARTPMELTVRLVGRVLHLAVRDGDPRLLVDPGGGVAADGHGYGRGLLIVDSMADGWGCAPTGEGKVVWARLAVPA